MKRVEEGVTWFAFGRISNRSCLLARQMQTIIKSTDWSTYSNYLYSCGTQLIFTGWLNICSTKGDQFLNSLHFLKYGELRRKKAIFDCNRNRKMVRSCPANRFSIWGSSRREQSGGRCVAGIWALVNVYVDGIWHKGETQLSSFFLMQIGWVRGHTNICRIPFHFLFKTEDHEIG